MKPIILCIDDRPDGKITLNQSLREILQNIFSSRYKLDFATTWNEARDILSEDPEKPVSLVLLDIEFENQEVQGSEIADLIKKINQELRIIVLTRKDNQGNKVRFKRKQNVIKYFVKQQLSDENNRLNLFNLAKAIIYDYKNEGWKLSWNPNEKTMTLSAGCIPIPVCIDVSNTEYQEVIQKCLKSPNTPVGPFGDQVLKDVNYDINKWVREKTEWRTWGILTKEGCAKGQLKLLIGSIVQPSAFMAPKESFVSHSEFEKFKKDIEERLGAIEKALNPKVPQKK